MHVIKVTVTLTFIYVKMVFTQLIDMKWCLLQQSKYRPYQGTFFIICEETNEDIDLLSESSINNSNLIRSCGIDNTPLVSAVYEGVAKIENYPWLGVLLYPAGDTLLTTTVILVTKQIVISSALDIHKLPKKYFRENTKVILGQNCSGPRIGVLDYNYHHEYSTGQYSTLVIIQLNISDVHQELRPICAPPGTFSKLQFHAMILPEDCKSSKINIYEMTAVPHDHCRQYYRKSGLDIASIWPKHAACGKARWGGECVWRNGAALVVKQDGRWHLLGFGVNGPGCQAPSRFVDYGMYRRWVSKSVAGIGRPAVTRLDSNHLILRRKSNSIQRYGPCDPGEIKYEIYTDTTTVKWKEKDGVGRTRYNVSIHTNVEYACVVFRADYAHQIAIVGKPQMSLKRYCVSSGPLCYGGGMIQMDFYVEIHFFQTFTFKLAAYGREVRILDWRGLLAYQNRVYPTLKLPWLAGMPIPPYE